MSKKGDSGPHALSIGQQLRNHYMEANGNFSMGHLINEEPSMISEWSKKRPRCSCSSSLVLQWINKQARTSHSSSMEGVVGNENQRRSSINKQKERNTISAMGLNEHDPPLMIPRKTNEHGGTSGNPSIGISSLHSLSIGQQLRSHQTETFGIFSKSHLINKEPSMFSEGSNRRPRCSCSSSLVLQRTNKHARTSSHSSSVSIVDHFASSILPQQLRNHNRAYDQFTLGMVDNSAYSIFPQQLSQHNRAYDPYTLGINYEILPVMHQQQKATSRNLLKQIEFGGRVRQNICSSQKMNSPISNSQNLSNGGVFPTTRFKSSIFDHAYEVFGLATNPILRLFPFGHKPNNYNNTSGWSQEGQIQVSSALNQGRASSTESVSPLQNGSHEKMFMKPHHNQDPCEVKPSTNGVAQRQNNKEQGIVEMFMTLLQNNKPLESELSTNNMVPFQSQNTQIINDENALSNQGSATLLIEDSTDIELIPNQAAKELIMEFRINTEEGKQDEILNPQQEEQVLCDNRRINFEKQNHIQEQHEHHVGKKGGDHQAIVLNLGSASPLIKDSVNLELIPNPATEELIKEFQVNTEEGKHDETLIPQEEQQEYCDERRINFEQQDHIQEHQELNVGGHQAIVPNFGSVSLLIEDSTDIQLITNQGVEEYIREFQVNTEEGKQDEIINPQQEEQENCDGGRNNFDQQDHVSEQQECNVGNIEQDHQAIVLNHSFASMLTEDSTDLKLIPNQELREFQVNTEGQQGEILNPQQEEQEYNDERRINFEQQDHIQEQHECNVGNIRQDYQDIVLNLGSASPLMEDPTDLELIPNQAAAELIRELLVNTEGQQDVIKNPQQEEQVYFDEGRINFEQQDPRIGV
ncbi:putative mediator of RNA polymerase II transcription subunit 26 isoform X4 [Macadamia integrifolia]|uniref:putative mediator of RNA polymerase II transcription subunit 26 isoform X4 n=1 Tax=Macadamia integrifolia TaxID=60698 RepID=UPI001C4EFCD7|nr:putative mediator of RNA polymerase II transcription subunit 26 isoform X4 [Macadamia integrifolia]